jgi:Family of unknown function (DUF5681)
MAAKTDQKQNHPGQWPKGISGNPKGRTVGSKHRATIAAKELLDGEAQALTRKCVELALDGDLVALRLCLERLIPPRKERHISLKLPKVACAGDIPEALAAIIQAVASGKITPSEGRELADILQVYRRWVDLSVQAVEDVPLDLSDFTKEELELAVSIGLKLKGGEEPV